MAAENSQDCDILPPHATPWPVFLVGCHRSGTTLARFLFDSHPNLACPPESKFIGGLQAFLDYPQAEAGLLSLGFTRRRIRREIRRMIERFLGAYARRQGKKRWIDKTPNYFRLLPFLEEIFEGNVLYLFIVRHPLDCIQSLEETFWDAGAAYPDPEIARAAHLYGKDRAGWARYWCEVYALLDSFAALHPERSHIFKYEDLAENPEATLGAALAFLGESLPERLAACAFAGRHTPGFEDYKIRHTRAIETGRIGKWRSWPAAEIEALWPIVDPVAARYGYEAPRRRHRKRPSSA
jgi:protein-tyrosine sulfotransferase